MEKSYGNYFRMLRESKNISMGSLADEYISKAMISKFERDESEISVSRFFHLLNKLNVRPSEFYLAMNNYSPDDFQVFLGEVNKYALDNNVSKLKILAESERSKWESQKYIYNYLNSIVVETVIADISNQKVSEEHIHVLTDYLFRCENWGYYEIVIFSYALVVFPMDTILVFSKQIPQKILLLKKSGQLFEIAINTLINTLNLCIRNNRFNDAFYFIKVIEDLKLSETMVFEKALFIFYKGLFYVRSKKNIDEGTQLVNDSLTILKLAGCNELHSNFLKEYETYKD